jgi:hypothetical protein
MGFQGPKTLGQFEANWTLDPDPTFHLGSPKYELAFELHFLDESISVTLQNDAM